MGKPATPSSAYLQSGGARTEHNCGASAWNCQSALLYACKRWESEIRLLWALAKDREDAARRGAIVTLSVRSLEPDWHAIGLQHKIQGPSLLAVAILPWLEVSDCSRPAPVLSSFFFLPFAWLRSYCS